MIFFDTQMQDFQKTPVYIVELVQKTFFTIASVR